MSSIVVMAAATVTSQVVALLGLWLRLRSQLRHEEEHRRLVRDVLDGLPKGVQVWDRRSDGRWLALVTTPERNDRGDGRG